MGEGEKGQEVVGKKNKNKKMQTVLLLLQPLEALEACIDAVVVMVAQGIQSSNERWERNALERTKSCNYLVAASGVSHRIFDERH